MKMISEFPAGEAMAAAEFLTSRAFETWFDRENENSDDITVLCVYLQSNSKDQGGFAEDT